MATSTDHKPLLGLLAANEPIPESCSPRLLRLALFLPGYDCVLMYRPGGRISHASALNQLPLPTAEGHVQNPPEIFMLLEQPRRQNHACHVFTKHCGLVVE